MKKIAFLLVFFMMNYASSQVQVADEDNHSFFGKADEAADKYDCCTKIIRRGLKDFPATLKVLLSLQSKIDGDKCTVCVGARIQHDGKNIGFFRAKAEQILEEKMPQAECRKKAMAAASQNMVQTIKQFLGTVGGDFSKQGEKFDLLSGDKISIQASTGTVLSREAHLRILEKLQGNPQVTVEGLKKLRINGDLKIKAEQSPDPQKGWVVTAVFEYRGTYGTTNLDAEVASEASDPTESGAFSKAVEKVIDLIETEIISITQVK